MNIKVQVVDPKAVIPTCGSAASAGYDLYACLPYTLSIQPHTTQKISTGLKMAIPEGYWGGIFARSGLATKKELRPANCVGVIDSDYRGEVIVALHNDSDEVRVIEPGQRIAQLLILPRYKICFEQVKELSKTDRSESGFGSTGE